MSGRWESPDNSVKWIKDSTAIQESHQYVLALDLKSPLATEVDITALPIVDDTAIIGSIGSVRDGELGYMVHPAVWGKGIAPEALRAYIPSFFARFTDKDELNAYTDSQNPRSNRVLEKIGFELVLTEPFESVELGSRMESKWKITRAIVDAWEQTPSK